MIARNPRVLNDQVVVCAASDIHHGSIEGTQIYSIDDEICLF